MIDEVNMSDIDPMIYEGAKWDASEVLYKPNEFEGRTLTNPPDFVIKKDGIAFWIQMKELAETERENGRSKDIAHIRGCLTEAAGVFDWDTDDQNINLIVMKTGQASYRNIDLGQAVFGDEVFKYGRFGKREWHRENNGFFHDPGFCSKVAGVIVIKREEHSPISGYAKLLFINDRFKDRLEQIRLILDFDRAIYFNELMLD
ncbi:hypothetical protein L9W92_10495 [Pelotomaculum terephthalicicum JT]|uniref:hypothetical protein n=1 Tax=Pelotomaculum TaxID=191373 RepID=UPI0009C8A7DD|nr:MULTISPECIES: hypothetical protein [Pelotomaculum]MCG9968480.1 hypothetical protein [Pelotomaculum terephthalicicum JT]OPX88903.1 MAG: hypothetical protein A4E54_01165 [Pelotomaculum sp. PtaB.Bin117]